MLKWYILLEDLTQEEILEIENININVCRNQYLDLLGVEDCFGLDRWGNLNFYWAPPDGSLVERLHTLAEVLERIL